MEKTPTVKSSWRERLRTTIITLGAILSIIAMFFGAWRYIDATYAKNVHVIYLNYKIEAKILGDELISAQDQIWKLEDRLNSLPVDDNNTSLIKSQLRQSTALKKRIDNELQITFGHLKQAEENTKH